jgi:hypothetical protein
MINPIRWVEGTVAGWEFRLRMNGHTRLAAILGWRAKRKVKR